MSLTLRAIADNCNTHILSKSTNDLANFTQADRDAVIKDGIKKYSRVRPVVIVQEYTAVDSNTYDLPIQWLEGFSTISIIENPADQSPPVIEKEENYYISNTPTGKKLRFKYTKPSVGTLFWVSYTIMHTMDSTGASTVPDTDLDVVTYVASMLLCQTFAAFYATKANNSLQNVEIVGYESRVSEYKGLATTFKDLYMSEVIDDDPGVYGSVNFMRNEYFDRDEY